MRNKTKSIKRVIFNSTPVLSTESAAKFDALRSDFRGDIKPRDTIERMFCDDIATLVWEMMRFRRTKVAILNLALRNALYEVLVEKLAEFDGGQEAVEYLDRWFVEDEIKQDVSEMLAKCNLDESAIEAEAFCQCSRELELIEHLLASAESRRDKALYNVDSYRQGLAQQLRSKAIEVIQNDNIPQIELKREPSRGLR